VVLDYYANGNDNFTDFLVAFAIAAYTNTVANQLIKDDKN
jgi:hypothetical protein